MDFNFDSPFDFGGGGNSVSSDSFRDKSRVFLNEVSIAAGTFNKKEMLILDNVIENLGLPERGCQMRIRTQQQINLISIVLKILYAHTLIDELTIATYTFNRISLDIVSGLVKGGWVKKLNVLLASSYGFRDKKYYDHLKSVFLDLSHDFNAHLVFAWSHFKITLAKCGEDYYQFEGSMNYSTNNMAENLLLENSKSMYYNDYKFITEVMQQKENKALEVIC